MHVVAEGFIYRCCMKYVFLKIKGSFSGLRQLLATESCLKMMENSLFHLKSSFRSRDI